MKLIFLDIDGVLNDFERSWRDVPDYNPEITPRCVQALNRIIRTTEAKLVLSSSWRNLITAGHMTLYGFERLLQSHGVSAWLIGHTRVNGDEYRWQEIAAWLRKPMYGPNEVPKGVIKRYCIIDDDSDAFGGRPGVQTAGGIGLTEADADLAIEILNRPPMPIPVTHPAGTAPPAKASTFVNEYGICYFANPPPFDLDR